MLSTMFTYFYTLLITKQQLYALHVLKTLGGEILHQQSKYPPPTHTHARTHIQKCAHTHTQACTHAHTHTHSVYRQCYSKTNLLCVATAWQSPVWMQVGNPELLLHRTDPCRTFRKLQDTVCLRSAFLPAECRALVTKKQTNKKRMHAHICPSTIHTTPPPPPPPTHTHTHTCMHTHMHQTS